MRVARYLPFLYLPSTFLVFVFLVQLRRHPELVFVEERVDVKYINNDPLHVVWWGSIKYVTSFVVHLYKPGLITREEGFRLYREHKVRSPPAHMTSQKNVIYYFKVERQ